MFRQEIKSLRKKLKSVEEKDEETELEDDDDDDCEDSDVENYQINIHKIFDYCSNDKKSANIHQREQVNQEQNEIKIITNKHSSRLQKWMKNTQILINGCNQISPSSKKTTTKNNLSLLPKYNEYKQLMAEQEAKMEDISHYVSDLIQAKRRVKQYMEKYEKEIPEKNELYKDAFLDYDKVREQRKLLFDNLLEFVDRLNEAIDDENELNEKKCKLFDKYNSLRAELKEFKCELNNCCVLIKEYQKFDKINDEKIHEMRLYFEKEWENFMKLWSNWDYKSIIIWIRYLIAENKLVLSQNIDLIEIEEEMKKCGVNGMWFERMDKNELKLIGFSTLNDRQQIYDKIQDLLSSYPNMNKYIIYEDEGQLNDFENRNFRNCDGKDGFNQNGIQIPTQFLCPITKKIMNEPVQIFDDFSYEKNAILKYLQQYKKSPITNESIDDDEFVILPNRKLAQKIQTFLKINPHLKFDITTLK